MTSPAKTTTDDFEMTTPPNYTQQFHELMQQIQTTRQQISNLQAEANEKQIESDKHNFTAEIKKLSNEIQNRRELKQELDEELNQIRQKTTPEIKSDLDSEVSELRREFFFAAESLESTRETIAKRKAINEHFLSTEPAKSVVEAEKKVAELTHRLNDVIRESARIDIDFEETFNPSENAPKKENRKLTFLKRKLQLIEKEKEQKNQQIKQMEKDHEKAMNQIRARKEEEERKKKLKAELSKNRRRELMAQQRKAAGLDTEGESETPPQSPKPEKSVNSAFDSILNDSSLSSPSPHQSKRRRRKKTTENQDETENPTETIEETPKKSTPSSPRRSKRKQNKQNNENEIVDIANNLLSTENDNGNSIQCKLCQLILLDVPPQSSKSETIGFSDPVICEIGDESNINPAIAGSIAKTNKEGNESELSLAISSQEVSQTDCDIEPSPELMKIFSNLNPLLNLIDNNNETEKEQNDENQNETTDKDINQNEQEANENENNQTENNEIDNNENQINENDNNENKENQDNENNENQVNENDENENKENENQVNDAENNEIANKNADEINQDEIIVIKDENEENKEDQQDLGGGTHIINNDEEVTKIVLEKKKVKKDIQRVFETTVLVDGFLREKSSDETSMKIDSLILLDINPTPLFEKLSAALKKKGVKAEGKFDQF